MANTTHPQFATGLRALGKRYRGLLCDVWGVIHDGVRSFPAANDALSEFRLGGGRVILLTNAPRPKAAVVAQLDRFGVPTTAYDDIVTSGEVARSVLAGSRGTKVFHVGPDRDLPLYDGLPVQLVNEAACELIACTGLVDDVKETPDDYADRLKRWRRRQLPMLCANPDIVVARGQTLAWCAGALAERYRELGGDTTVVGKPYPAIYEMALARLNGVEPVLALGDGIDTDVRGAVDASIDVVFITGGIHFAEFGPRDTPDIASVHAFLARAGLGAAGLLVRLAG
jgi:HAD superfamily hydrolase (TIGR01459 family)